MINIEEIKQSVQDIYEMREDDESAHSMEDSLYQEFINHIVETDNGALGDMAREVLKTREIEFKRWCA